ncbi:hypothetical protein BD410DRAFT_844975 [Rickenella mellea]|uniref:Uncharacterized protein n=1 Tax=Rickenella mellea TaxID=50990 RepID=A0A4Y7PJN6_9AGAM|nr:hypothetical protein BD410DRAFT_844975 [Rickenella mellea]
MARGSCTTRTSSPDESPAPPPPVYTPTTPNPVGPDVNPLSQLETTTCEPATVETETAQPSPVNIPGQRNRPPRASDAESEHRIRYLNPPTNHNKWLARDPEEVIDEVAVTRSLLTRVQSIFVDPSYKTFPLVLRFEVPMESSYRSRYRTLVELGKLYWGRSIKTYYPQDVPRTASFRFRQLYEALEQAITPDIYLLSDNCSYVYGPNIEGLKKFTNRISNLQSFYAPYLDKRLLNTCHIPVWGKYGVEEEWNKVYTYWDYQTLQTTFVAETMDYFHEFYAALDLSAPSFKLDDED